MNGFLLVLIVLVVVAIGFAVYGSSKATGKRNAASLADAKADARRLIDRLGGQVLNLTGADEAAKGRPRGLANGFLNTEVKLPWP